MIKEYNRLTTHAIRLFLLLLINAFALSSCTPPTITTINTPVPSETPQATDTPTPSATTTPIASPSPTISPALLERPAFLAWPLPAHIGLARISQYPDTPWSRNMLGLNAGYTCPPMFGYIPDAGSLVYWRDLSIPAAQDKDQADPHQFEMVECYAGHEGTDIKAPAGTPVYASADGLVQQWRLNGLNAMLVLKHCLGGIWNANGQCTGGKQWYTTYMHIIPDPALLVENTPLAQGAQLGTIYDQTINSHLHLELGLDKRNSANVVNPWGQDRAPWAECMWIDASLCFDPGPIYQRMAWYTDDGNLFIQQGEAAPLEADAPAGIGMLRWWGDQLTFRDSANSLRTPSNPQPLAENVAAFEGASQHLGVLDHHGILRVLENGEWTLQAENAQAFSISSHRLGYLTLDGVLHVKNGNLQNPWTTVAQNVRAFQLVDNRIAYLDMQNNLYVSEGEMNAEYQKMAEGVRAFQVTNLRLGMIDQNNELLVKEGNLRAEWVLQAENVETFQLADNRILMHSRDGRFQFKQGSLYQPWGELPISSQAQVRLNGPLPVYPSQNGLGVPSGQINIWGVGVNVTGVGGMALSARFVKTIAGETMVGCPNTGVG